MVEKPIVLQTSIGLMGRPAASFIQAAKRHEADVYLEKDHKIYNGKSIMSVLGMGAGKGAKFILRVDGPNEEETLKSLCDFLEHDLQQF